MTPEDIDTLRNTVREALRCSTLGDTSLNVVAVEDLDDLVVIAKDVVGAGSEYRERPMEEDFYLDPKGVWVYRWRDERLVVTSSIEREIAREAEMDNRAMQEEADELEARVAELEADNREAEQSLLATKNALSGTQQVRDYYKQLAEEWINETEKLRVEAATFKQVARFHAARVAELEGALAEGIEAFRLTREYAGESLLPRIEGWSWFDWCEKA